VAVLVQKVSPIKTVADLRGKHVVVNKGSNAHYLLLKALEEAKVPYKDIKVSFVPPAGARAAFESNQVDAWSIWDPFQASVEEASGARVLRDGRGLVQNPAYYIGTRPFADANPQLVQLFLEQIAATGAWANQNQSKVVALLAPLLGIKDQALAKALARNRFGVAPVDDRILAAQQKVADTFHAEKLIPRPIQVAEARWKSPRV
jgi:sulfonate transport system substrate-binding protein